MPLPQVLVDAALADTKDVSESVACIVLASQRASAVAPEWIAAEISGWCDAIVPYAAAKILADGSAPPTWSASIEQELAGLRTKAAWIGAVLSSLAGSETDVIAGLCEALRDSTLTSKETELLETEAVRRVSSSLVERSMAAGSIAGEEPEWESVASILADDASDRFGFVDEGIRALAVIAAVEDAKVRDALENQRNPDGLEGAALQCRLEQIWSSLDERKIAEAAEHVSGGIARVAYGLHVLVFDALERNQGTVDRSDLIALTMPGADGEPSWLDAYYESEGQDSGSIMQNLLEIACGEGSGPWEIAAARDRVDDNVGGILSEEIRASGIFSADWGEAAAIPDRLLANHIARLSPDAGFAAWLLERIGLEVPDGIADLVSDASLDPVAEAFLGQGEYLYASYAATAFMTNLASSGDTADFWRYHDRAGNEASSHGLELIRLAGDASSFAGQYSGDIMDWAARKRPDDPAGAVSLVRFIENGYGSPGLVGGGTSDPALRWLAGKLSSDADAILTAASEASAKLEFSLEHERQSAAASAASAGGILHWRQFLERKASSDSLGSGGAGVPAPTQPGDPEGAATAIPRAATSWKEGMLADSCEDAQKKTMSLEAALASWSEMVVDSADQYSTFGDALKELGDAAEESTQSPENTFDESSIARTPANLVAASRVARAEYQSLAYRSDDARKAIVRLGQAIALSSDGSAMTARLKELETEIAEAGIAHDAAMDRYREAGYGYDAAGEQYDDAYTATKTLFNKLEIARDAYERESAISRWASSAYLGDTDNGTDVLTSSEYRSPAAELSLAEAALSRAGAAVGMLSGLYDDDAVARPYEDPEHASAREAFEESYRRMLLVSKARSAVGDALGKADRKSVV